MILLISAHARALNPRIEHVYEPVHDWRLPNPQFSCRVSCDALCYNNRAIFRFVRTFVCPSVKIILKYQSRIAVREKKTICHHNMNCKTDWKKWQSSVVRSERIVTYWHSHTHTETQLCTATWTPDPQSQTECAHTQCSFKRLVIDSIQSFIHIIKFNYLIEFAFLLMLWCCDAVMLISNRRCVELSMARSCLLHGATPLSFLRSCSWLLPTKKIAEWQKRILAQAVRFQYGNN